MKKLPVITILCFLLVCALGVEIYREHKAKMQDRAEWKQIGDNLGESLRETNESLEKMPKIGN